MAFEDLEAHLVSLGIAPLGERFEPIPPEVWQAIEAEAGGAFPDVVRWLFARFGGFSFAGGVFYFDPRQQAEEMVGWFLGAAELASEFEWTRESLPPDLVPLVDDGAGNFVCVGVGPGNAGTVWFYLHDAPTDRRLYPIADSIEGFLRSLHRGELEEEEEPRRGDDEDTRFLLSTLSTGSTEERGLTLRGLATRPSRNPRVVAAIAALLGDRSACLLGIPLRYGELRLLAAEALAAERRAAGDHGGVEVTCILPQTAGDLMREMDRLGLPWPKGDPVDASIAALEQLQARGALPERSVRLSS